ncbi:MAG TPA: phosphohydrolase [Bacteroidetes bacterium]|nr:phosphohydrolase [Bacteroidota bacterium]
MISRQEALNLINKYIRKKENIGISLAVEAVLRTLAKRFGEDEDLWGLTGLLHNIDYEYTVEEQQKRGILSAQILDGLLPEEGINAIKANNYFNTDYLPETSLDKALISAEAATCLIVATLKASYTKNIDDIDVKLLFENFKDTSFAPSCNRNRIKLCNDIEIVVEDFLGLGLNAIQKIQNSLKNELF